MFASICVNFFLYHKIVARSLKLHGKQKFDVSAFLQLDVTNMTKKKISNRVHKVQPGI